MSNKALLPIAAATVALLAGCESSDDKSGAYWNTESHAQSSQQSSAESQSAASSTSTASSDTTADDTLVGGVDAVPFGALSWTFGGVNGSNAAKTSAAISRLRVASDALYYSWAGDTLSSWGLSDGNAGALACFFVQRGDGSWVGGKFDWISTSRTSRSLEHVTGGYGGWSLAGVPNPCPCAFVIISADGRKRTNVVAGTWHR